MSGDLRILEQLGWNARFAEQLAALALPEVVPARIVRQDKGAYWVRGAFGDAAAVVAGRLRHVARHRADLPCVGDWVAVKVTLSRATAAKDNFRGEESEPALQHKAVIHAVLPRFTKFSRKAAGNVSEEQVVAANIDTVFLVSGLDGDFNLRRIERYLALARESGAAPVIVLNKADLCSDLPKHLQRVAGIAAGATVLAVTALHAEGIEVLRPLFDKRQTIALLGSSGVGKSTLLNTLLGHEHMRTTAVRDWDHRGRHTTTHRELFLLPDGGAVIDTPGMRELQVWGDDDALHDAFNDIDALAGACRFADCSHTREPGCRVLQAVAAGELDEHRHASYVKLRAELQATDKRHKAATQRGRKPT